MDSSTSYDPQRGIVDSTDREGVGRFAYDVDSRTWTWSPGVYAIHGFGVGDVVPSTDLMRVHVHPDDLASVTEIHARAVQEGTSFRAYYRIVDASRQVRRVIAVGSAVRGDDGRVCRLEGHAVDVTIASQEAVADQLGDARRDFEGHRAVIEQAKGVLMQQLAVDEAEAFDVLRAASQRLNVKVRDLAQRLVEAAARGGRVDGRTDAVVLALGDLPDGPASPRGPQLAGPDRGDR